MVTSFWERGGGGGHSNPSTPPCIRPSHEVGGGGGGFLHLVGELLAPIHGVTMQWCNVVKAGGMERLSSVCAYLVTVNHW